MFLRTTQSQIDNQSTDEKLPEVNGEEENKEEYNRRIEINKMRYTIGLSVGLGILGNLFITTSFRLADKSNWLNAFLFVISGIFLFLIIRKLKFFITLDYPKEILEE